MDLLQHHFIVWYSILREMAAAAERIFRGEIMRDIAPRSEEDVLGNAFHRMIALFTGKLV